MSEGNAENKDRIVARLASRNRGLRDTTKAQGERLKEQDAAIAALTAQVDQLKGNADPQGLARKVAELQGQLRQRDHRAVFDRVAKAAGATEDVLDDLWQLSGYKAESDTPDEASISAAIAEQKEKRARFFAPPAGGNETNPAVPPVKPAPGSGKGGTSTTGVPQVSDDLVQHDPAFVMRNYKAVVAASKEKVGAIFPGGIS
jgi:hypothetical protein